jgi:hypothetical protein
MNYILGVLGSEEKDESGKLVYGMQIEITQEVYDWLDNHDIEYTEKREKIFLCNNLKYIDLGVKLETVEDEEIDLDIEFLVMGEGGEA